MLYSIPVCKSYHSIKYILLNFAYMHEFVKKKLALKRVFNLFKIVEELNGKWTYSNYFHLIFVEEIQLRN